MKTFLEMLRLMEQDPSGWGWIDKQRLKADDAEVVSWYDKKTKMWKAQVVDSNQRRISPVLTDETRPKAERAARMAPRHDPSENF